MWNDFLATLPPMRGQRAGVLETSEFRRIRDAAAREWAVDPHLDSMRAHYTEQLRQPGGTQTLHAIQAVALHELKVLRSCFAPILPGGGKTLIFLLAAEALGATRPAVCMPAALETDFRREAHALVAHWKIRPLKIFTYEALSRVNNHAALEAYHPDFLGCDESHALKNTKAGVTRVVSTFVKARRKAGDPLALLLASGSITSRTLRDFWHHLRWTHGTGMPLPHEPEELQQWMWAVDEKLSDGLRWDPGALLSIAPERRTDAHLSPINQARARLGRRLMMTPGVVGSSGDLPDVELRCDVARLAPSEAVRSAVETMRATWETPDGHPFDTAMDLWRHERELSCDLYYRWTHRPPLEWLARRKAWSKFLRDTLSHSRKLFTPLAVVRAIIRGDVNDGGLYAQWREVEPAFKPVTEAVWIDDQALRFAGAWLERERGIAWVQHAAFGQRLSAATGVPFFQQQGCSPAGTKISMHDGPAIASISSCSKGFNLQGTPRTKACHWKNLIVTCPTKNAIAEQLLARTHRYGQQQPVVYVTFLQMLTGDAKALDQCRADATNFVQLITMQPQRLGVANWINDNQRKET